MKNHHAFLNTLQNNIAPLIQDVHEHPLYTQLNSLDALRLFTQHHVFLVWDFMCLLKELHRRLVSTAAPWFPPKDALSAHLISSILVEEEGDLTEDGLHYASHFELYLTGMKAIGANTQLIQDCLSALKNGFDLETTLHAVALNTATKNFVLTTFQFFKRPIHELASAFVFGREGITSPMFSSMLEQLEKQLDPQHQAQLKPLIYYFKRHIELDSSEHFPKALQMLKNLMGDDKTKWQEAEQAAVLALNARLDFLTEVESTLLNLIT